MSRTVSDQIVGILREWGVRRVFGYPGDGINGVMGALHRATDDIEFILARHEEAAALMAVGHAKFTGELGVCIATSGPGAVHLLNGLYDAKLDHQPVLAIVGQQSRSALGGSYQQEIDLTSLFKDVAGAYVHMVTVPEQLPNVVDRAARIAVSRRTVTCLVIPNDVQSLDAVEPEDLPREHGIVPGGSGVGEPEVVPAMGDLQQAADILNTGERVAMLIGSGARGAADRVVRTADTLGAGVAKALLGKDVLPDDLPFVTGTIGLLGTKPSDRMMAGSDTLLMVGSSFPYSEFLPEPGSARGVQIDIDPTMIGIRYPMDVSLVGDAAGTLDALLPMLEQKTERTWRKTIEDDIEEWWDLIDAQARAEAEPLNPQLVFAELSPRLPDRSIVTVDVGSSTIWYARHVRLRSGMRASVSGTLASMGCAVPYAVAAKLAEPDRPVVALVGDGAMQMNGINELITVDQYRDRWSDPTFVVLVLHNNDLNMVTWEQRAMEGDPKFDASQRIVDFPYARYAELLGFEGIRVDRPEALGDAWDRAFAAGRPALIEAVTDPNVPPMPPHLSWEQMANMMRATLGGDTDRAGYVRQGIRSVLAGILDR
ncbi:MAG: thiamine pyrophosphate-requiring protein [Acidimicrobiia bacterium]